jgi:NAD(P)-dependent dehydrogenase (short-subunit alcohol dehydrogenase family)
VAARCSAPSPSQPGPVPPGPDAPSCSNDEPCPGRHRFCSTPFAQIDGCRRGVSVDAGATGRCASRTRQPWSPGPVGIGRAIALALAEPGAQVVAADIDEPGGTATAGLAPAGRCRFRRMDMNLLGPLRATQAALALMRRASGGSVVTSPRPPAWARRRTSPRVRGGQGRLIRFTSTLDDLGDVRVNCLVPDWVATERVTPAEVATDPTDPAEHRHGDHPAARPRRLVGRAGAGARTGPIGAAARPGLKPH